MNSLDDRFLVIKSIKKQVKIFNKLKNEISEAYKTNFQQNIKNQSIKLSQNLELLTLKNKMIKLQKSDSWKNNLLKNIVVKKNDYIRKIKEKSKSFSSFKEFSKENKEDVSTINFSEQIIDIISKIKDVNFENDELLKIRNRLRTKLNNQNQNKIFSRDFKQG